MFVETSRHDLQLELSRAGLVQFAERVVFPNHPRRGDADGGFISARLASLRRMARSVAIYHHILVDGCDPGHARVYSGTRTNPASMADFADAPDLSPDAQLLYLDGNLARGQRSLGELGQTGTHCECARARVIDSCPGSARV